MAVEHGEIIEVEDEDGGEEEEEVSIFDIVNNLKAYATNMVQWRVPLTCCNSCVASEVI
jgi:hypothetical protein